jgi:hypothetical protein
MEIIRTDPYEGFYEPSTLKHKKYPRHVVEAVDHLVRLSRGCTDVVTARDWGIVGKIVEFWCRMYPEEWVQFQGQISDIRATRARSDGYSREKGSAGVRYLAAVPGRLMRLVKTCFPAQQWNRSFTEKFIKNFNIVRVGNKVDTWFTLPDAPARRQTLDEAVEQIVQPKKPVSKTKRAKVATKS